MKRLIWLTLLIALFFTIILLVSCGGGGGGGGSSPSPKITSGIWTWVSGANTTNQAGVYGTKGFSNVPGARAFSVSWIDGSGNRWLFGGYGRDSAGTEGDLNDLWKFNGTNWIWVYGANIANQPGNYDKKNEPSSSNLPGAREGSVSWIDGSGNLWLFGGYGRDSAGTAGWLNDLWKFDGANWVWVSGAIVTNQTGSYGTQGVASASNVPGARAFSVSWIDGSGNRWLFGGYGRDSAGTEGDLNDLWKFDGTSWTWVSGANTAGQAGVYGTKGVANASNVPGARYGSVSWTDTSGNLWLFGGVAFNFFNDLWKYDGTNWTWVSGADTVNQQGVYGTKGVANVSNVPGARFGSVSWTDTNSNLWLIGGYGYDSASTDDELNDLWKFNGTNWTWVSGADTVNQQGVYGTKGVANASNVPGARDYSVSWIDGSGNLWLFGGWGYDSAGALDDLNDLWMFDGTNWTWVSGAEIVNQKGVYGTKGASNIPGVRDGAVSWTDKSGNLWFFGGGGYDSAGNWGYLNDLWKFDGTTWTWVSGANTRNQLGVYGTRGVAAASNVPGARTYSVSWIDGSGNLWLFGGIRYGFDNHFNDLWKFDGTNWTWVSGADIVDQKGVYGEKGVADASNVPGARNRSVSWTDASGNLLLFGGWGHDSTGTEGIGLNDLWKFDGTNWTWVSGADIVEQKGFYGTKGLANVSNVPGARYKSVSWIDAKGNLWLFGGYGYASADNWNLLNDLWKFDGTNWTWVSGADIVDQMGVYGTKGTASASNVPGSRAYSVSWTDKSGNLWLFGGYGYASAGMSDRLNDLWKFDGTNWTWVSGADIANQAGVYGTKSAASATIVPGARSGSVSWTDKSGNLWLFGGYGYASAGMSDRLNDLWRFSLL